MNQKGKKDDCWGCNSNIETVTQRLKEMFVEMGQKTRIENGQKPAERAVFRKQHGIAYGKLIINKDIRPEFKLGIFAGNEYECAVRFSSDTTPTSPDLHSTLGVGLKLFGVKGEKLIGEGDTADFIFQNIDRFFARDAQQMCNFTTAGVVDRDYPSYIDKHPKLAAILQAMTKEEASTLSASYWAILPFKLGEEQIVKYRLVPAAGTERGTPFNNNNYLALDLQQRLRAGSSRFQLEIQLRTHPDTMPVDDAQKVWNTEESPYICIAELHLPQQDVTAIGQSEFGSSLSFNIWRTLPEHEPLGSIAQARKAVYEASAQARHQANGISPQEPESVNPPFIGNTDEASECIVKAAIYPPIGIMRVGNSEDEYFIGPLVDTAIPRQEASYYRDETGALKRQAAAFRIYGLNAAGKAVKELTMDNAEITWTVSLANQKASWYQFNIALDIPEAADAPASMLRNMNVPDRKTLLIDGGVQSLSQKGISKGLQFEGKFQGKKVYLGEMRSDESGRLIMLGGHGKSENINGDLAITFANNEGWYDDMSDGPVTAEVKYKGAALQVDPAWIVCAPPDYAPMQKSVRTMWDLMRDVAVKSGMLHRPARPSFSKDILPIFERMTNLQWVNAGFAGAFGFGGQFNYTTEEWVKKLGDPSPAHMEMRRTISNNFRRFDVSGAQAAQLWPWLYGDAISIPAEGSVRQHCTLSDLQLSFLDQWVKGDFDADFDPNEKKPTSIDELNMADQPDMLTKAAMEFCLADAFHPGCEMTWPMRTAGMYMAPFRLSHASDTNPFKGWYYGPVMSNDVLPLAKGPLLGGQVAGGITRWMAIPWQTDTASCRDGYTSDYDPYLPTFWPARVPNNILNERRYKETLDSNLSEETRRQAFADRADWLDDLPLNGQPATYTNQINSMIDHFSRLAVVQPRHGVEHNPNFPKYMQVGIVPTKEQDKKLLAKILDELKHLAHGVDAAHPVQKVLEKAVDQLSDKNLLTEGETEETNRGELIAMLTSELTHDFQSSPAVKKALALLTAQQPKKAEPLHVKQERKADIGMGVPEKLGRFRRYRPQ